MRRTVAALLCVFVVLLVAVACGGSDDGAVSEPPPTAELEPVPPAEEPEATAPRVSEQAEPAPEPPPEATPETELGAEAPLTEAEELVRNLDGEVVAISRGHVRG